VRRALPPSTSGTSGARGERGARGAASLRPRAGADTGGGLPDTSELSTLGPEGFVSALEQAYGDEALGNEVRDRMVDDREFSIGIKQAMTNPEYAERLRAAIDASPYMQAAVDEAQRRAAGDAVKAVMGDDSIQGQLAAMSNQPEVLRQTQEESEDLLKRVAEELADGVAEFRQEYEPDADDLIAKFTEISEVGYDAFVKYSISDVNVKNAVINALFDEMEEARKVAMEGIDGKGGGDRR